MTERTDDGSGNSRAVAPVTGAVAAVALGFLAAIVVVPRGADPLATAALAVLTLLAVAAATFVSDRSPNAVPTVLAGTALGLGGSAALVSTVGSLALVAGVVAGVAVLVAGLVHAYGRFVVETVEREAARSQGVEE